jgi:hypothetical protein
MVDGLNRRLYVSSLIAVVIALAVVRLFALPQWDDDAGPDLPSIVGSLLDSFLGASLAALGVSLLVLWLFPSGTDNKDEATIIPPREIGSELVDSASKATDWGYRGHTGRYLRTTVLPILEQAANKHGRYVDISVELLDPENDEAIEFFVNYRRQVNPDKVDYWTSQRAKIEILATVAALALASQRSPRLSCSVFLGSSVSPFTVDMSSSVAIVTRESSSMSALKYPIGSSFFDSVREDLHLSRRQARELPRLPAGSYGLDTGGAVSTVLDELDLGREVSLGMIASIVDVIDKPVSPYPHG